MSLIVPKASSDPTTSWSHPGLPGDLRALISIASATIVIHILTGGKYGFHRDELATLDDARHLAWGYVAYPPLTPFFARVSLALFGTSLAGFRFFASLANALAVVLTGLVTRDLGSRRSAQVMAALAAVPFCIAAGSLMQYVSFDFLFWVLTAYFVVQLLKSDDPRWWLAIGCAVGLGMMAKYSMPFLVAGLLMGVLLTDKRRYLASKWLWLGVAVAALIFLPNFLWQIQHDFVSIQFLRHIHARDIRIGRTKNFLPGQFEVTLLAFPLWIAGLFACFFSGMFRRFRLLGWMYLTPLLLFLVLKGRSYYLAGAYPMLYAAGAAWAEKRLSSLGSRRAAAVRAFAWSVLLADIAAAIALTLPIAPIHSRWWKVAIKTNGDLSEEFGWSELVETVARIRDRLPMSDRTDLGILAGNYGEAGAVDLYGARYELPASISGVNSFWFRGYGNPPPQTLIVVGLPVEFLQNHFSSCQLVAHTWNRYNVENEETREHRDIFVCRGLRESWPEFWRIFRYYG
ncbi:MAG TPA: glycosyltransferase family 39 protein [Candidatus Acidoferrales bacterium]|nr:glycosyltransferase family 39 protein [Candidatus Acidoferrales bacterium]